MCVVSMVGDHFSQKWPDINPGSAGPVTSPGYIQYPQYPSLLEFEQLKREVLEMKALLRKAKEYDERTGQKDCEQDEKLRKLREIAKLVGVDLDEIFQPKAQP